MRDEHPWKHLEPHFELFFNHVGNSGVDDAPHYLKLFEALEPTQIQSGVRLLRVVPSPMDSAENATQNWNLEFYRKLKEKFQAYKLLHDVPFYPFGYFAFKRICGKLKKKALRDKERLEGYFIYARNGPSTQNSEDRMEFAEELKKGWDAFGKLSEKDQKIGALYRRGVPAAEAAKILGLPNANAYNIASHRMFKRFDKHLNALE